MNIKIRSVNFEITPAINDYIKKKISSLDKFVDDPVSTLCEVEIGRTTKHHKSGDIFRAEVNLSIPGIKQIYAVAQEVDLYTAIDIVRNDAERGIISKKNKSETLWRKGASKLKNLLKRIDIRKK